MADSEKIYRKFISVACPEFGGAAGALERAIRDNIIPERFRDQLEPSSNLYNDSSVSTSFDPQMNASGSLLAICWILRPFRNRQDKFVKLYVEREGPIEDFWKSLRDNPDFREVGLVDDLQFTLQLALVLQNNAALIKLVKVGERLAGPPASLRDLARKLEENALKELIDSLANREAEGFRRVCPERQERRDAITMPTKSWRP